MVHKYLDMMVMDHDKDDDSMHHDRNDEKWYCCRMLVLKKPENLFHSVLIRSISVEVIFCMFAEEHRHSIGLL